MARDTANILRRGGSKTRPCTRRRLRLPHYDYAAAGAYFITVCTHDRACLFGDIREGAMRTNAFGQAVETCWNDLTRHYPHVTLDAFVVMPNHVHGIILLACPETASSTRHALPEIVRALKSFSARRIDAIRNASSQSVWQRGYYEHIIRNDISLDEIRNYIVANPACWATDRNNPANGVRAGLRPAPTDPAGGRTPIPP